MPVFIFGRNAGAATSEPTAAPASALSLSSPNGPIYVAGIIVGGVLVLGIVIWLSIRAYRKRARENREEKRGAAFLSVKGLVRDDEYMEAKSEASSHYVPPGLENQDVFSRSNLTASVVLPDKAILRSNASNDEILAYHTQNGTVPRPFAPKPFSFAMGAGQGGSPRNSSLPSPDSLFPRQSFMSAGSRFSVVSGSSSIDSTGGGARRIRQLFTPVLPDELFIQTLGERLTVMQSFDDGWVLVGRENSTLGSIQKSLFKTSSSASDPNVELGVIPAWCFIKPCKGLRAERPVRTSSLGITVQVDAPAASSRDDIISWSNF